MTGIKGFLEKGMKSINSVLNSPYTAETMAIKEESGGIEGRVISAEFRWKDLGRIIGNKSRYTICSYEEAVNIYRVCSQPLSGAQCYADLKKGNEHVLYRNRKYLICPRKTLYYPEKRKVFNEEKWAE